MLYKFLKRVRRLVTSSSNAPPPNIETNRDIATKNLLELQTSIAESRMQMALLAFETHSLRRTFASMPFTLTGDYTTPKLKTLNDIFWRSLEKRKERLG